ncbi:exosome complex protein Rrp4 [uncultured Methanosphaera sp.]|uniref:exosome complex protein Rrp4 n=1 Tax=uncultured Methanosphaera sp. TaxID=262501 RepID=UPI0025F2E22B|nr:exosome complex protein Rrp4 [uncultured Methanosphaera sp.]
MLFVENKEVVLPGSLLTDNDNYKLGRGTFKEKGKIYSDITGLVYINSDTISVIPFKYTYKPQYGDLIIGRVTSSSYSSWSININSTYHGYLSTSELYDKNEQNINNIINVNDMLLLRVANVDEINRVKLTLRARGLGKFNQGIIVRVKQPTVHFLSEENAFITTMIQEYTYTDMIVAKNGLIWINGLKENVEMILKIIEKIEEQPFKHNLIKNVQNMIINP